MSERQEAAGWWLASDGKWYPPESHPSVLDQDPAAAIAPATGYAGFWLRAGAAVLDVIIVWIGFIVAVLAIAAVAPPLVLVTFAGPWLYFALSESSDKQATLGKQAVGIKVTDMDGRRITFVRASGRFFGKIFSALILYIGFMMAGWTAKKQALHDLMADTLVVRA